MQTLNRSSPDRPERVPTTSVARLACRWAGIFTFIYVTLGYASQIGLLIARASAADISPLFVGLGFITFSSWVVAGWLMTPRVYSLAVPNALGALGSLVLIILWLIYR